MKAEDIDIMEEYKRSDGRRDWAQNASTWLYPGDIICVISGETAAEIKELVKKDRDQLSDAVVRWWKKDQQIRKGL